MDWGYVKDVGIILIIVDAGSGWIEAFPCRDRSSNSVIKCLRTVFTRFGIPQVVVSDNAREFTSDDLNMWLTAQGCRKLESPPTSPELMVQRKGLFRL